VACAREGRLPPPQDYDAVVLGSRIRWGQHAPEILEYVREHRDELGHKPSAFFSVSLAVALPFTGADPRGHLRRTFEELAWSPDHAASLGRIGTPHVAALADKLAVSLPDSAPVSECSPAYGPMC
jgi:menaquinone-dependent protoporphyrinogen IX oxidase